MKEAAPNGVLRHTADKEEQLGADRKTVFFKAIVIVNLMLLIEAITKNTTYESRRLG